MWGGEGVLIQWRHPSANDKGAGALRKVSLQGLTFATESRTQNEL